MKSFKKWLRKNGSGRVIVGSIMTLLVIAFTLCSFLYPDAAINEMHFADRLAKPGLVGGDMRYPFGTDAMGRSILLRCMAGGRISLMITFLAVIGTTMLGSVLGIISAYYGKFIDGLIGILAEIKLTLPMMLLVVLFLSVLGPSILAMAFVLAINDWVTIFRNVRASSLVERNKDYIQSARTMGASNGRIIFKYILPNVMPSIIVLSTLLISTVVLSEANLSYLGVGVERPSASWGRMVFDGQQYIQQAWWISTFPALIIAFFVIGVNLLGDGLRKITKMD